MTATRFASTSGGTGSYAGVYDITASPYNATTAATDNTTAIQAAINDAKASGGNVYVPPGQFKFASQLSCDLPSKAFGIVGAASAVGGISPFASELQYTGTGSTPAISCHSVYDFGFENIRFTYTSTSFTGDLIDIDGAPHAADCTNWRIVGCSSFNLGASRTARSIIRLNNAINGAIYDCGWGGAVNNIRIGDPGGSYVVGLKIANCTFNYANDAMILFGTADGENIIIDNCRFEASTNTTGIRGSTVFRGDAADNAQYNPIITNCWFGDAGAPLIWIDNVIVQSNAYTGILSGNRFASNGGVTGIHARLKGKWLSMGNSFEGGTAYDSDVPTNLNLTSIANFFNTANMNPVAWNYATGQPASLRSIHESSTDFLGSQAGVKGNAASFTTSGNVDLVLAAQASPSTYTAAGAKAAVYYGNNGRPFLALQAPDDGTDGSVTLLAGATPAEVVKVQRAKIGFFATAPVARPATYTLHAGTSSRDLPSGATLVQVEQALRQLLKDLGQTSGYGLVQADA